MGACARVYVGDRRDELVEGGEALAMERVGALLLAQADGDHLQQAALDLAGEVGVRLDPVDRHDQVRVLERVAVHEDRHAGSDLTELDGLHARTDLAADRLRGDAVGGEHLELALGGGTAMAAHGGHDEHLGACLAHPFDRRRHDLVDPVDAAAADGQADPRARRDGGHDRLERRAHRSAHVPDLGRVHAVAHQGPLGQGAVHELGETGPAVGRTGRFAWLAQGRRIAQLPAARIRPATIGLAHPPVSLLRGMSAAYLWIRAEPPCASACTCPSVAMVVSPG